MLYVQSIEAKVVRNWLPGLRGCQELTVEGAAEERREKIQGRSEPCGEGGRR